MKKIIAFLCMFCGVHAFLFSQTPQDTVYTHEFLELRRADDLKWMTRDQGAIDRYVDENRKMTDKSCDVLFLGSSSINLWDGIEQDFAPLKIIRRSYGGSAVRDMLYHYNVIARGYRPRAIVLYVENDLSGDSRHDLTAGEAFDYLRVFVNRLKRDYKGIPVYMLSYKPSPSRAKMIPKQKLVNALLEEYASITPDVYFVDVASSMYDAEGNLREDIYKPDKLHLNRKGYDLWTSILKPLLMQYKQ